VPMIEGSLAANRIQFRARKADLHPMPRVAVHRSYRASMQWHSARHANYGKSDHRI